MDKSLSTTVTLTEDLFVGRSYHLGAIPPINSSFTNLKNM